MPNYLSPGVYMEEVSSGSKPIEGVGTAVAAFVGFAATGPIDQPTLVTNWQQFTRTFGEFIPGSYLAHAVYGYFLNGGGIAYVVRIGGNSAGVEGAAAQLPTAELPAVGENAKVALTVSVRPSAAAADGAVSVEVADASEPSEEAFKLVVKRGGAVVEDFDNLTARKGPNNVATKLRESQVVAVEQPRGGAALAPARGEVVLAAAPPAVPAVVGSRDYIGDTTERTGFRGLEAVDDVTMLCVPDVIAAYQQGLLDAEGVKAVHLEMIAHCERMGDRVAIIDPPPGLNAQQIRTWRQDEAGYDSKYAALYWPWIKVMDPSTGRAAPMPPSGHVAGVWARNDATRGVHKAPANEVVRGALAPELAITKGEHDTLNPKGVNCIRAFPGQGVRIWGARTMSSDSEWRYLNVRRLFNYVEKSILSGTNWVVFEPNDPKLWDSVKRTVTMFLRRVWRDGALFGRTPAEAFYVKCDEENNPPENRDNGILTVEIGIAPVKPAEFVVFRISQFNEGAGVEE